MGFSFSLRPFFLSLSFIVLFTNLELSSMVESDSDITTLVYKGCAKQAFTDPGGVYSQALSALFQTLLSQSMKVKFYKTTTGTAQTTINGLFQCRGDLSNSDCYNCVSKLPTLSDKLCGSNTIASRIQLVGCYMLYEVSVLENGVVNNHGFFTTNYQSIYVLGQCEGDIGDSDCGECIKNTVQKAQVECGDSNSGQIYLHKCFISYNYYIHGVPKRSPSSFSHPLAASSTETGQDTGKTVAIILGGAAGIGFIVILMMFARNSMKKHEDS
ncbi:cysteine-rich repeat secretory protein 3-like isoform X1 [Gossypium australe]|uniref:Cysteine-rich repeat secretory protein 3-like isoform X1 n=1 Tax=Gossypium australe TaxID=47621 RepID=A0A5B6UDD4_9ROSI|nr:cysteine-rich repeat secretory protein 3-like isoform X1 [Gossypium australe]